MNWEAEPPEVALPLAGPFHGVSQGSAQVRSIGEQPSTGRVR